MKKLKPVKKKSFTVSQENVEEWLDVIRGKLAETESLMKDANEKLEAVKQFVAENLPARKDF